MSGQLAFTRSRPAGQSQGAAAGRKSTETLVEAARSPVHPFGTGGGSRYQQSGRAAIASGGDRAQDLLRQQNFEGCPSLASAGFDRCHLPTRWAVFHPIRGRACSVTTGPSSVTK